MNKKLQKTLTLAAVFACMLKQNVGAQNVPITFEPGGNGYAWAWTPFDNVTNLAIQMVANPNTTGINPSSTCAMMTALVAGQPWAGFESLHPGSNPTTLPASQLGAFTLSSSNAIIKMMVYKSVISDVGIKFANATNGSTGEIKVANTLINQWEELTFNFSSKIGEPTSTNIDQIVFFPDFQLPPSMNGPGARTTDNICYIDSITFNPVTVPLAPLLAAPAPTALASNVISLFSNTYTNVAMATWATSWSAATLTSLQLPNTTGGAVINDTKQYTNLNYVGAEPIATINANAMNTFNIDIWTPNMTQFRVKLVDYGANGAFGGGDDVEQELPFTPTLSGWNTYNIPLANFTNLTTKGNIGQIIFSGNPSGSGNVYIDNVYFSYVAPIVPMLAAPAPIVPAANVISLSSHAYTNVPVNTWLTPWSASSYNSLMLPDVVGGAAVNETKRYFGLTYAGIETTGPNLIDATAMNYFNIDIWTPNATSVSIKLVDFGANGVWEPQPGSDNVEHEITLTPTLSGWNRYSLPLTSFTGLTTRAHMAQYIISADPDGLADVYVDNIYFSTTAPLGLDLLSFTAQLNNSSAVLNWQTSNEENMKTFAIEKSTDATNFTTIGNVEAKNAINTKYTFTDAAVLTNTYYRLKMIEQDGKFTYSSTVMVNKTASNGIKLFPNPANTELHINTKTNIGNLQVTNTQGAVVIQKFVPSNYYKLDVSNLPNGTYFINANKSKQTFIKQ